MSFNFKFICFLDKKNTVFLNTHISEIQKYYKLYQNYI